MKIKQFLTAWWKDWLARMSGPATVPFAIAALYVSSGNLRVLYGTMAVVCAGCTSYRLWLNEHVALEAERHQNQFPNINADIERVYIVPPVIRGAKVFVLASVHNPKKPEAR